MKFPHHVYVLNLLNTIPAAKCTPEEGVAAWDHMFGYIHAHFPVPRDVIKNYPDTDFRNHALDTDKLLSMPRDLFEANLESLPPYFNEVLFPMAVARYMLRECHLNLNHRNTRTFAEFHNRYGALILYRY